MMTHGRLNVVIISECIQMPNHVVHLNLIQCFTIPQKKKKKAWRERYSLFVETENTKKHQIDNLELKNTVNKILALSIQTQ